MSRTATLAVGQFQRVGDDKEANLAKMSQLARDAARQGAQLICFPEMCLSSAGKQGGLAEPVPGPAVERLGAIARQNNLFVIAGLPEKDERMGKLHNSCVLVSPQGALVTCYRKRCLYLGENKTFTPGTQNVVEDITFAPSPTLPHAHPPTPLTSCRLALTICYDYVFAEYIRRLVDAGAELICHPTAWKTTAVCEQWRYSPMAYRAMGMTRALENTVFFLSANLWDSEDKDKTTRNIGQSSIIAPWGEILAEVPQGEGIAVATVDLDAPEGWQRAAAPYPEDRRRLGF